jgi:hypothetical protein
VSSGLRPVFMVNPKASICILLISDSHAGGEEEQMSVQTVTHGSNPSTGRKFLKVMLVTGIPFGLFMGIFWAFSYGPIPGIVMGSLSGVFFGALMSAFTAYQTKKFQSRRPLAPDEDLIKEGGANHFKNFEAVGGWIYLTKKGLLFRSHSMNLQKDELSIPLQQIGEVRPRMTFAIIPNGLEIKTIDGRIEKFVVEDRQDWVKKILEARDRIAVLPQ